MNLAARCIETLARVLHPSEVCSASAAVRGFGDEMSVRNKKLLPVHKKRKTKCKEL